MRRLWAAGAAIVVCLALGGLPVLAQEASENPSAPLAEQAVVTGTQVDCNPVKMWTTGYENGVSQRRDGVVACEMAMDDPRVSGMATVDYNSDGYGDDWVNWGTWELAGPDGTWVGSWTGAEPGGGIYHGGSALSLLVAAGTGAYEGWSYIASGRDSGIVGLIYEGPPPPWVPLPSTPSE